MVKDTTDTEPAAPGSAALLLVGLGWLGAVLYAAYAMTTGSAESVAEVLRTAAAALPGVVATTLVAGASIGAAAGRQVRSAAGRLGAGLVLGVLPGLAVAAAIRFGIDGGTAVTALAIPIVAGIAGGALAVLPTEVLRAGLWGASSVFLAGVVSGVTQPELVKLLGNDAGARWPLSQSVVSGLAAALCALPVLRVAGGRLLWCLAAGALPGLLLLGAEGLTRVGGSAAAELADGWGAEALVQLSDTARLRHALIVLTVGGLTALLAGALKSLVTWPARRRRPTDPTAFHQSLIRIGLAAGERYGFALTGGYAVQAAGFLERPTEDIDLFTVWERRDDFDTAARAIVEAYRAAGLRVADERRHDSFTRLTVSDDRQTAKVDLGVDLRANDPVRTPIGPVTHPDDVVANKMRALYERAQASDFIDIDAALRSGRYDSATLVQLARRSDITFDGRVLADALARAGELPDADFAQYGLVGERLEGLRHRFAQWRAALLDRTGPAS